MDFLNPETIAVIGASRESGKVGHEIFKNLKNQGFRGKVYPVNVKGGEILGETAFTSLKGIPGTIDMVVVVTPAVTVPDVVKECAAKSVKTVVVVSAGFGEVHTEDGKKLETQIVAIAKEHKIALVGPNCLGVIRPSIGMNASFAKDMPPAGSVALISQSGATAVGIMDMAPAIGLGLSAMLSIGNKAVMDECDYLEWAANDKETKVIGFYLESIRDGRRFLEIARKVTPKKPIVLLKAGVSTQGGKAAASHTGALAGSDAAIDALCAQSGMRRAHSMEEFLDLLTVLSMEPPLLSRNIAVITNAGGPGILATDAAEKDGLTLASLSPAIAADLKKALPPAASIGNPIDVLGDAAADRYEAALIACAKDASIDGVVCLLTPQVMTPCDDIATAIVKVFKKYPLMPVVTSFVGDASVGNARAILRANGIPTLDTPERAVHAMAALMKKSNGGVVVSSTNHTPRAPLVGLGATRLEKLLGNAHGLLSEDLTKELFALYDLPLPKQALATSGDDAARMLNDIGAPAIAKISSPDILHKTDIGGVRGGIATEADARAAYAEIMANVKKNAPAATIRGVLIQELLPAGSEFIIGGLRDASFGPLVMVGLGGIYTELFRDTSFRIAPIGDDEAYAMLAELKAWKLLLGLRGKKASDIPAVASMIRAVGRMLVDCPRIKELDINPVIVGEDRVTIADAKVILD